MKREDLKKHTTRRVIFRLDFYPLEDATADVIKTKLRTEFIGQGKKFKYYRESYANDYEINPARFDAQSLSNPTITLEAKLTSSVKTFNYYNAGNNTNSIRLVFCKTYLGLFVNQDEKYLTFEKYKDIILESLKIISTHAGETLTFTRCGLRKLNDITLKKEAKISNYLNQELFSTGNFTLPNSTIQSYDRRYNIAHDTMLNVNLILTVLSGKTANIKTKRAAFDIDVYSINHDFLDALIPKGDEQLESLNKTIFDYYSKCLSCELCEKLTHADNINDEMIIAGVSNNE